MKLTLSPLFGLGICTLGLLFTTSEITLAQVTSDGTVNTQVNQTDNVSEITGGETRGTNLFHSFQEFSVGAGNEAFFKNADAIKNIFSRVTGGKASTIDGLIRANGSASLFLINPAGIIFGEGGSLSIGGSFYGSSADSILFEDGEFSATDLNNPPVLTINAPIGLGFRDNPGDITNNSVANDGKGLEVTTGNNLSLLGGNVRFDGGVITAPGAIVNLGGLSAAGTIGINNDGSLSFPENVARADVSLKNTSIVSVDGEGGGNVAINAKNLEILSGSVVSTGIIPGNQQADAQAGDIVIDATDKVSIAGEGDSSSAIVNTVGDLSGSDFSSTTPTKGNAGNILLNTGELEGTGEFVIGSVSNGEGNAGKVTVTARKSVSLTGGGNPELGSGLTSFVGPSGLGDGADITITTPSLSINGEGLAVISASTLGQGNAGNIFINGTDSISLDNGSQLQATTFGEGDAGNIVINAEKADISLNNQSLFTTSVFTGATGQGGNIDLKAASLSLTNGSRIFASTFGEGDAGNLTIDANNINITQTEAEPTVFTGIFADVSSPAKVEGGDIQITAKDSIVVEGVNTFISAEVNPDAAGNAGSVTLNTPNLSILQGGVIGVNTFGEGNAGNLTINAPSGTVSVDGEDSIIRANVNTIAKGTGGSVNIDTGTVNLTNGGQISASTFGEGDAGNLTIDANDAVVLKGNGSAIRAQVEPDATGEGGDVTINTSTLSLTNEGQIAVSTFGTGNAGNLKIDANDIKITETETEPIIYTGIFADVSSPAKVEGGDIQITAKDSIVVEGVDTFISAKVDSDAAGNGGSVNINTRNLNVTNGGQILASTFGEGNSGLLDISASNSVSLDGGENGLLSGVFNSVESGAKGDARGIKITTGSLDVKNGAQITAGTFSKGNAGSIVIKASDSISFDGQGEFFSGTFSNVQLGGEGTAGKIEIETPSLNVTNGAIISASTLDKGNAGQLTINAPSGTVGTVSVDGESSVIKANVEFGATGTGGNVNIDTGTLNVTNGGQVSALTRSDGRAGNLTIDASESIQLSGSTETGRGGLFASAIDGGSGKGGNLTITTDRLSIFDGATINVSNFFSLGQGVPGTGEAGKLTIDANSVKLDTGGIITAATRSGNGGDITFSIRDRLELDGNSEISAGAFGDASGGNITIDAPNGFVIGFPAGENGSGNDIIANAEKQGGTIKIDAQGVLGFTEGVATEQRQTDSNQSFIRLKNGSNELDVTSATGSQLDGKIDISIPDVNSLQGEINTPEKPVDSQETVQQACSVGRGTSSNTLAVKGKGGVPPAPDLPLNSQTIMVNGKDTETQTNQAQYQEIKPIHTSYGDIIPAQGAIVTEDGRVILTAYRTDGNSRVPQASANCGR